VLNIKPQDVAALIEAFEHSSAQEMRVAIGDLEMQLSKSADGLRQAWSARQSQPAHAPAPGTGSAQATKLAPRPESAPPAAPSAGVSTAVNPGSMTAPAGHDFIRAANLGTFYRSPKPGAPSYVEVGSKVDVETEVCLIEVMKLFTPLVAGVKGTIQDVLVKDGALVEFDQPLFLVQVG
jgi:acetyl-CoA carboxylase biotin carboxyl carrier protein